MPGGCAARCDRRAVESCPVTVGESAPVLSGTAVYQSNDRPGQAPVAGGGPGCLIVQRRLVERASEGAASGGVDRRLVQPEDAQGGGRDAAHRPLPRRAVA